jgi:hypothetical protein
VSVEPKTDYGFNWIDDNEGRDWYTAAGRLTKTGGAHLQALALQGWVHERNGEAATLYELWDKHFIPNYPDPNMTPKTGGNNASSLIRIWMNRYRWVREIGTTASGRLIYGVQPQLLELIDEHGGPTTRRTHWAIFDTIAAAGRGGSPSHKKTETKRAASTAVEPAPVADEPPISQPPIGAAKLFTADFRSDGVLIAYDEFEAIVNLLGHLADGGQS